MRNATISLLFVCTVSILSGGTSGKIMGRITDRDSGQPLVGANIQILNTSFGAASDAEGEYVILNVAPGIYTVKATYMGYDNFSFEQVDVNVDLTTSLDFLLSVSVLQGKEVIVTADQERIQRDLTSSISIIRKEEIEALPVANFTEALSLQAGVVGSGANLHVRGGRSNEVAYLIDGMYVQDPLLGGLATNIGNDAIQEMSLLTGTFNAEYGNALSGVVNIITREGGEKLSASIEYQGPRTFFERDGESYPTKHNLVNYTSTVFRDSLGTIIADSGKGDLTQFSEYRLRASVSGPLGLPNIRFFYNKDIDNRGSYLPFGYYLTDSDFLKLTLLNISNLKLNITQRINKSRWQNYSHSWNLISERYYTQRSESYHTAMALTHTISQNFFYDIRYSVFNQTYYSGVGKDTSEYLPWVAYTTDPDVGDGSEFYSMADPPQLIDETTNTIEIKSDFVWQINQSNEVKFGLQYKDHDLELWDIYDPQRDNPYIDDYTTTPYETGIYIQDKIEFPILVLNLGLRYDYVNANATFRTNPLDTASVVEVKSRSQFSPRLGIAHPISDRTKIHFAYGHFFQNPDFQHFYENSQYDTGVREPIFGQADLDAERTVSYEVGLTHRFNSWAKMNLTAYYKDVTGLIGTRYFPAYTDDRYVGYTLIVNEDYANMKGFELNVDIGPTHYFSGGFTYTYSVAKGSASSEMEQYPGSRESTRLYFLSFDKPHVFNASGRFSLGQGEGPAVLGGFRPLENTQYSFILRFSSGYPYTPSGRTVGYAIRNSLRRPSTHSLDFEFGKEFNFGALFTGRLFVEILNITDHRNILYVYTDTGDPDYSIGNDSELYMRDPSNYGPPRTVRLGLSWKF